MEAESRESCQNMIDELDDSISENSNIRQLFDPIRDSFRERLFLNDVQIKKLKKIYQEYRDE